MAGSCAKGQIQKCETVRISRVQWMATGQNGVSGKNAQRTVDVATELGPGLAITHQLSMVGVHVRGIPWKQLCVTLSLAQFMEHGVLGSRGVHAVKVVEEVPRRE